MPEETKVDSSHQKLWLFALVASLTLGGCQQQGKTTVEDIQAATEEATEQQEEAKEAEQELAKTKTEFQQTRERDDYVQSKEKELVEVDTTLQQQRNKARQLQEQDQQNLTSKIEAVELKRDVAKERLDEIRKAEPTEWKELQGETDKTFAELQQALAQVESAPAQPGASESTPTQIDTPQTGQPQEN
jgi:hypothetical protein